MPSERHICLECLCDLPRTHFEIQSHNPMADLYNAHIEASGADSPETSLRSSHRCAALAVPPFTRSRATTVSGESAPETLQAGMGYQYATALFFYSGNYKKISRALKYRRDFGCGEYFAGMLGDSLKGSALYSDVDLVVPVPLHWTRRLSRGYNQAEVLAREVAKRLGAPCNAGLLVRQKRTKTQTKVSAQERSGNVRGAFALRGQPPAGVRHILLVDDVYTTGATLSACRDALSSALGPSVRISLATLACVPH